MMMVLIFTIDQWPGSGQEAAGCKKSMMKTSLLTAGLVIMLNPETPGRFIGWEQKVNYFQVAEWLAPSAHCPGQRGQDAGAEEQSVSEERSPPDHHCYRDIDDPRLPT